VGTPDAAIASETRYSRRSRTQRGTAVPTPRERSRPCALELNVTPDSILTDDFAQESPGHRRVAVRSRQTDDPHRQSRPVRLLAEFGIPEKIASPASPSNPAVSKPSSVANFRFGAIQRGPRTGRRIDPGKRTVRGDGRRCCRKGNALLRKELHCVNDDVSLRALVADGYPAGFSGFEPEGAQRLKTVRARRLLLLVHRDRGLAIRVMNGHGDIGARLPRAP